MNLPRASARLGSMATTVQNIENSSEASRRFILQNAISQREMTYTDSTEAMASPIASKLFGFPWTETVTVGTQFVEIRKQDWVEWSVLEEPLKGLIEEHFADSEASEENPEPPKAEKNTLETPEAKTIQQLIEDQINPALAAHGGYVVLHSVENDQVFLEMGGGCQGCAMSYQTMKEGIEGAIKEVVPSVKEVVDVTNHSMGDNPFYE